MGVLVVFCMYTLVWLVVYRCVLTHFVCIGIIYMHTHDRSTRAMPTSRPTRRRRTKRFGHCGGMLE